MKNPFEILHYNFLSIVWTEKLVHRVLNNFEEVKPKTTFPIHHH